MKKHILHIALIILLAGCSHGPDDVSAEVAATEQDTVPEVIVPETHGIGSQFYVTYPELVYFVDPGKKVDFRNFVYSNYALRNGIYVESDPESIDSLAWKATHRISDSLYLVELHHLYGGSSSTQEQLFYLYKRGKKDLTLTSKLFFSGNMSPSIEGNKLTLRAEYYETGDPRCCPSEIETGYFEIRDDKMIHLRSEFSPNQIAITERAAIN